MNRRRFLQLLGLGATAVLTGDALERALWVPGAKTIFLPPVKPYVEVGFDSSLLPSFSAEFLRPSIQRLADDIDYEVLRRLGGGNQFVTPEWVAREALLVLEQNLKFVTQINQQYEDGYVSRVFARWCYA